MDDQAASKPKLINLNHVSPLNDAATMHSNQRVSINRRFLNVQMAKAIKSVEIISVDGCIQVKKRKNVLRVEQREQSRQQIQLKGFNGGHKSATRGRQSPKVHRTLSQIDVAD